MKKLISIVMAVICLMSLGGAMAYEAGDAKVGLGADLDEAQIEQIYRDFGIPRGTVDEVIVTNADERAYLVGLVDEGKIGHKALSCVYISVLEPGSGLSVITKNINWCTEQMYISALTTAGVSDARVIVTAPFEVSGTAALTGVYKAYEAITGFDLSSLAKAVGAEELVVTGQLAEYIGDEEATRLIGELKKILDVTETMTDSQVKEEINKLAAQYNIQITDGQTDQLLKLCRQLEKLEVSELKDKIVSITKTVEKAAETKNKVTGAVTTFTEKVTDFVNDVSSFFGKLFGKK